MFSIIHESTDISNYAISFERNVQICTGIGTLDFVVTKDVPVSFSTWDSIILYEDSTKKGKFNISTISREATTGNYIVSCQDNSKRLVDYFITDFYEIDYYSTTRYWIELFLNEAGLSYEFNTTSQGSPLSENMSLGLSSAYDNIIQLLQLSGWYLYFDEDGKAIVGSLEVNSSVFSETFSDSEILTINENSNDSMLRNRAVVWGNSGIFTEISTHTQWNYDTTDKRAVVLANSGIRDLATASSLATTLLEEFDSITETLTLEIAGYYNVYIGDRIFINSNFTSGSGLITTLSTSGSSKGYITTITINERCPRLFGYYNISGDDYVYASTYYGVKRKLLVGSEWEDYSTGLTNLNIIDLSVNNGNLACIASSGELFLRNITQSGWYQFVPSSVNQSIYHPSGIGFYNPLIEETSSYFYPYSGGQYVACSIGKSNNITYALFTTSGFTWVTSIVSSGNYDHSMIVTSGNSYNHYGFDIDTNGTQYISTRGFDADSKYTIRQNSDDLYFINYFQWGFYWTNGERNQRVQNFAPQLATIINSASLTISSQAPYGFPISTTTTIGDNQFFYGYSSIYARWERWDYINNVRVTCNSLAFPDSGAYTGFFKAYDSQDYMVAYRNTDSNMYFQKIDFISGNATNIGTVPHPSDLLTIINNVRNPVLIKTAYGYYALWFIIRYSGGLPVDCIGYSFDFQTNTYASWTVIPFFPNYYFTDSIGDPADNSWYHNSCNPLILNDRVIFAPYTNPNQKAVNTHAKYGVIISMGVSDSNYYEYSETNNEPTALRPDKMIADFDPGHFYINIDGFAYPDYAKLCRGNYLGGISSILSGWDSDSPYGHTKPFVLCSNKFGAYRISYAGTIYSLPDDSIVGNLEAEIYNYNSPNTIGFINRVGVPIDSYYNRIYYTYYQDAGGGSTYKHLKYYDLDDNTTGYIFQNTVTTTTPTTPVGNRFLVNDYVHYNNTSNYTSDEISIFNKSKVITPTNIYDTDTRGYQYRKYDEVFDSITNLNLDLSLDYPLIAYTRGLNYLYVSQYGASGTFNTLIYNRSINDVRSLTISGVKNIGIASSGIYCVQYTTAMSGNIVGSGVNLMSGILLRMETTNYSHTTTPYIFGNTISGFYQRDINSSGQFNYSTGIYPNSITMIRTDDLL